MMERTIPRSTRSPNAPVALPLGARPSPTIHGRQGAIKEKHLRGFAPGKGPRLLVVDDQALNRKVLEQQLQLLGLACVMAESGEQALTRLAAEHFDIVVTDCFMPSMNGLELTRRLRVLEAAGRPRTTIIALTANAVAGAAARCYQAGADDYLSKPLRLEELAAALHRWHDGDRHPIAGDAALRPVQDGRPAPAGTAGLADILGNDDPQVLARVMQEFLSAWQDSLATLQRLLQERDASGLAEAAHTAKGLASYGAAPQLADDCARLEKLARTHHWPDAALALDALTVETERLRDHLTELR